MNSALKRKNQRGFTLIEMMIAVAIFMVISGAIFSLLNDSQKRFQTESQVLGSFEEARLGLDQIVRDANDAGYPPLNHFAVVPVFPTYTVGPLAWNPAYPLAPCQIGTAGGGTCVSPTDFDVIFEGDNDGTGVKWTRYQLQGTTLFRGATPKLLGADPVATTDALGVMLPYVTNVMNNATPAQIAQFKVNYPTMFPGGNPVPIFQYTCDIPNNVPFPCTNVVAAGNNFPTNVRDIEITLIVMTPQRDAQNNRFRLVEMNGRGHRINPNK